MGRFTDRVDTSTLGCAAYSSIRVEAGGWRAELAVPRDYGHVSVAFDWDSNPPRARLVHEDGDDGEATEWVEMRPTSAAGSS